MSQLFYSATTGGFYNAEVHGDRMPGDVVEITNEEHAALLEGQAQGRVISADGSGKPILSDTPAPTAEQLQAQINTEARTYLASTDWYVIRWQESGTPIPEDIATARTEARANVIEV